MFPIFLFRPQSREKHCYFTLRSTHSLALLHQLLPCLPCSCPTYLQQANRLDCSKGLRFAGDGCEDRKNPSPLCPLCLMHDHTSSHLFECKSLPTSLSSLDLWTNPDKVEPFLATWGRDCWLPHDFGCWTLLAARWWSGVDNNNNNRKNPALDKVFTIANFHAPHKE